MWGNKSRLAIGLAILLAIVVTYAFRSTPRISNEGAERPQSEFTPNSGLTDAGKAANEYDQDGEHSEATISPLLNNGPHDRPLNTKVPVHDEGKEADTRVDSAPTEAVSRIGRVVTPEDAARLIRDCPGRGSKGCRALAEFAARVAAAPDNVDDGWSTWMEEQILEDLQSVASANSLTEIGVKCSAGGCAFYVRAVSSNYPPGGSTGRWLDSFETWLNRRPWKDELADAGGVEQLRSFAAIRIIESTSRPYTVWYVAPKRP